jgi:hypothetical protein
VLLEELALERARFVYALAELSKFLKDKYLLMGLTFNQ